MGNIIDLVNEYPIFKEQKMKLPLQSIISIDDEHTDDRAFLVDMMDTWSTDEHNAFFNDMLCAINFIASSDPQEIAYTDINRIISLNYPGDKAVVPFDDVKPLLIQFHIAEPMVAPLSIPNFFPIAVAISPCTAFAIWLSIVLASFILRIFLITTAPMIIANVFTSIFPSKSPIFLKIFDHLILVTAFISALNKPLTHLLIAFARDFASKFSKNPLIPLAILSPRLLQSNVSPNDKAVYIAVFSELAIVLPTA